MSQPFAPPQQNIPRIQRALLDWFAVNQRRLPWRVHYTPYEVWVSEVMLQQTQMERGVDYFNRWMARFPDIAALAAADEEAVLRQWEGLGYYSRARHLLAAARKIMAEHGGAFPSDLEAIRALPGVGPYTAGAIASIAFGEKLPCVDANVERVIARVFDVDSPVKQDPAAGVVRRWALRLVPEGLAREHNQAMMELGALVCRKKPRCEVCPLAVFCSSRHLGIVEQRPCRAKRPLSSPCRPSPACCGAQGAFLCRSVRLPACGATCGSSPAAGWNRMKARSRPWCANLWKKPLLPCAWPQRMALSATATLPIV